MTVDFSRYSAPVTPGSIGKYSKTAKSETSEPKRVDYAHLDIIAEVERITGCMLRRHTRTTGQYTCACPFTGCASRHDAFLVFDRTELEEGQVHFWCRRCERRGSLMDLVMLLGEDRTGVKPTWAEACTDLRIDPRTWREQIDNQTGQRKRPSARTKKRHQEAKRRELKQAELQLLDAIYSRANAALVNGQISRKDAEPVLLDHARTYLADRGFTLEQATQLGMAYLPTRQESRTQDQRLSAWRGRIIFPLNGPSGEHGYAGRTIWGWQPGMDAASHKAQLEAWNEKHPRNRIPRYYKTSTTAFYGYDLACQARILVLVEGEFDAASVRLALAGQDEIAVVAMGKHIQAKFVPLSVLHVVLALDIDAAGQEHIEQQMNRLTAVGVTLSIAEPVAGKDWNECHQRAGLAAIRETILSVCKEYLTGASPPTPPQPVVETSQVIPTLASDGTPTAQAEPPVIPAERKSDEQQDSPPLVVSTNVVQVYCHKHRRPLCYSDQRGGRYCDDNDCWAHLRLLRMGAALSYPEVWGIIDPRAYLPDTSQPPLSISKRGYPIYPTRPPIRQRRIEASADAWFAFVAEHSYVDIDQVIKDVLRQRKELRANG